MEYKVNSGMWGSMFGVPCIVADNLLKLADGNNLKVLLYLLRNSGTTVKTEEISASTGVPEKQVGDSIAFWEQVNIFSPENCQTEPSAENIIQTAPETDKPPVKETVAPPAKIIYPPSELKHINLENPDVAELLQAVQGVIPNPNQCIINSIVRIYQNFGLKTEVIMTLLTYCSTVDKVHANYIETLAKDWYEKEIDSLVKAQNEADRLTDLNSYASKIKKIFGINRTTPNIKSMIESCHTAGYNEEIIRYAYEITIENTGDFSFPYIRKILSSWIEKGIRTVDEARNESAEHKKNYKPKPDNSDGFVAEEYEMFLNNF